MGLFLAGSWVWGGTDQDPPDGLPSGRVFFIPWLSNEVLADDNLFRRNAENTDFPPVSDVEASLAVGVTAHVPFRMSNLQLGYEGTASAYRRSSVDNSDTHRGTFQLNLNSARFDKFIVDGSYLQGITQRLTADDEIADVTVIEGVPLVRSDLAFEWSRQVPQRPSWKARLEWVDQRYEPRTETEALWVDYEGWSLRSEYGQPIYRRGYLAASYTGRRQDQFATRSVTPVDELLRRERYDALEFGYRGLVGRNQPIYLALGYGVLGYTDLQLDPGEEPPADFRGPVGSVTWRLPVGAASNMSVSANRRPTSSLSYNTYYLVNELRVRFDRPATQLSRYGLVGLFSKNRYGAPLDEPLLGNFTIEPCDSSAAPGEDIIRRDTRRQFEGFWEWFIHPRMALRMTAGHNRRETNCDNGVGSYVSNTVGMTFKLGWFD